MFSKKIVGLDIADNTIEAVYLKGNSLHAKVLSLARVSLDLGIVEKGRIKDEEKLAVVLKQLFDKAKNNKISDRNIIFGFPDSVTYTYIFNLPPHSKRDRKNLIKEEVATSVPERQEDVIYSYRVLRQSKEGVEVLVIAVNREIFYEWIRFFKKNKFEIQTYDIEVLAIFRDLYSVLPKEPVCIVDIGTDSTKINIFDKEGLHFNYSAMMAGGDISRDLEKGLKLKDEEAEDLKKKHGLTGKDKKVLKIVQKRVDEILQEIKGAVKYFENNTTSKVAEVILVGGSSLLPGLVEYAQEKLGVITKLGKSRILEKKVSLEYIEAVGLALRGLNKSWDKKDPELLWDGGVKPKKEIKKNVVEADKEDESVSEKDGGEVEAKSEEKEKKTGNTKLLLLLLFFVVIILAGAIFYQKYQKKEVKKMMNEQNILVPEMGDLDSNMVVPPEDEPDEIILEDLNLLTTTSSVTNTDPGV